MGLGIIVGTTVGMLVAMVVLMATEVGVAERGGVLQAPKTRIISRNPIVWAFISHFFP